MRLFAVTCGALALLAAPASAQWSPWQDVLGHPGIKYALKCDNCGTAGRHQWWVRFENDQSQRVAFSFRIDIAALSNVHFGDRVIIDPGHTQDGWNAVEDLGSTPIVYTGMWKSGPDAS